MDAVFEFIISHYQFVVTLGISYALFVAKLPRRKYFLLRLFGCIALLLLNASLWNSNLDAHIAVITLCYCSIYIMFVAMTMISFKISFQTALFCCTGAYAVEHLSYKVYDTIIFSTGYGDSFLIFFLVLIFVYGIVNTIAYFLFVRRMQLNGNIWCSNFVAVALCVFTLLVTTYFNLLFVELSANISTQLHAIVNVAVVLICCLVLFLLFSIYHNGKIFKENDILQCMVDKEHEQFDLMKKTIDIVNVKCHDLKHQIHGLNRGISEEELQTIEKNISIYDNISHSGNNALDIVLSEKGLICNYNNIELTYIADGEKLSFMTDSDIYSLFGNALDNAIKAVSVLDKDMKVINLSVRSVMGLISVHIENYYAGEIKLVEGLPETTQADKNYHGFGMKSIEMIVKKYNGELIINTQDNLFKLDITFFL